MDENAAIPVACEDLPSPELVEACHDLLDALETVAIHVDFLVHTDGDPGERQAACEVTREAVEKIYRLVRKLRDGQHGRAGRSASAA